RPSTSFAESSGASLEFQTRGSGLNFDFPACPPRPIVRRRHISKSGPDPGVWKARDPAVNAQRPVQRLPDAVVNKIAAGESVERPASVVKELVENSLDAGASRIEISVRGAGRQLIAVTDDGRGMPTEDCLLALERHATSKLRTETDLDAIGTLGFRGEALPA